MAIKPPALPENATIAVVAPASPPQTRSETEQAVAYFEDRGHRVVLGPNHRKVHGYLAGTDEERAADLQWALSDPGIDMVHALEGGYGTARLYPLIDWEAIGDPRIVCGFSDLTALHLFIQRHADWVSLYGPSFLRFTRSKGDYQLTKETEEWFHRALKPEPLGRVFEDPEEPYVLTLGEGVAEAPLVGGCLTLLCSSIGTPYEVRDRGQDPDRRGPQHRSVPGRHRPQSPAPRRQARRDRGIRVRDQRQPPVPDASGGAGVDAVDRGDPRRADRAARGTGDLERAVRPRQAPGDDAPGGDGADRRRGQEPRDPRSRREGPEGPA